MGGGLLLGGQGPGLPPRRLVVLTTAGDPAHWSARILEHARREPRWHTNEVPGPCPWIDPEALAEQSRLLLPSQYARLHLNVWTAPEDRLTAQDDLEACLVLDGPQDPIPGCRYAAGVDLGVSNDRTAVVVGHRDETGTVTVDRLAVWEGTRQDPVQLSEVEEWLAAASEFRPCRILVDPYQATLLAQRLKRRGLQVAEAPMTQQSNNRRTLRLYRALRDRALRLPRHAVLADELGRLRLKESSPGVYRYDHPQGGHDDVVTALSIVVDHFATGAEADRRRQLAVEVSPGSVTSPSHWRSRWH